MFNLIFELTVTTLFNQNNNKRKTAIQLTIPALISFIALACILFGARLDIIHLFSATTPYWDAWGHGGFLHRYITNDINFEYFIKTANGHHQIFSKILGISAFELNASQWDVKVIMIANAVLWTLSGLILITIAWLNRRLINAPLLITLIVVLWVFPISLVNAIWGAQSHNYFMIFFSIIGCWGITHKPLTTLWWIGASSMTACCLTLGGGSFLPLSVTTIYWLLTILNADKRRDNIITALTTSVIMVFGVALILSQPSLSSYIITDDLARVARTITRSLSWPLANHTWPVIVFLLPVLILSYQIFIKRKDANQLAIFALCLYGFILIICIVIGVSRPAGYPARRYFEFLSLGFLASTIILMLLSNQQFNIKPWLTGSMIVAWFGVLAVAIPWQTNVFQLTRADNEKYADLQTYHVRGYSITGDRVYLSHEDTRAISFPNANNLATIIDNLQKEDMMPFSFQFYGELKQAKPAAPISNVNDRFDHSFIRNGTFKQQTKETGLGLYQEAVMGSYLYDDENDEALGSKAKAHFVSQTYQINRPIVMIPVFGNLGAENLSLALANVETGVITNVAPPNQSQLKPDTWHNLFVNVPVGKYQLIAKDDSEDGWFAVASPRTIGPLSYFSLKALDSAHLLWKIGLLLLLIVHYRYLVRFFIGKRHTSIHP